MSSQTAAAMEERWRQRNMKAKSLSSWKLRVPGHVAPRWARVHLYNLNRDRHFENLAAATLPQSNKTEIHDLPVEIMVKIFWLVLAAKNMEYNLGLPRVCARWTRIVYDFVYVQGFGVPDYSGLLKDHLDLFATALGESHYNAVLPEDVCRSVLDRYRFAMNPRVIAYTIQIAERKEGSVHSLHAVRGTQQFCINTFGVQFQELTDKSKIDFMLAIFVVEFTQDVFASQRISLQTVLESKFIRRLDVERLVDLGQSILFRSTVWHDFARDINDALDISHEHIDAKLACKYAGVRLSPNMRKRILYLLRNTEYHS